MAKIRVLDTSVSNKIAAGEVVERPAAAVKEMIENSIDAGADTITVEIKNGGITYMRVSDNGCGMSKEDAPTAFLRHATSKIQTADDLDAIYTLGFRGEALASIASVSKVELVTKQKDDETGTRVVIEDGEILSVTQTGAPCGTTIIVKDLFYNTPARMKFLKKDHTEAGYILNIIENMVLSNPHISFKVINNGKEVLFTPGDNSIKNAVYLVYGKDYPKHMIEVDGNDPLVKVSGLIGKSEAARSNRNMQSLYINGRYVKSKMLTVAVEEAYKGQLMVGKFPSYVLYVSVPAESIDINVHPTKLEVKFSDEKTVYSAVYWAVKNALYNSDKTKYFADVTKMDTKELEATDEGAKKAEDTAFMPQQKEVKKPEFDEIKGVQMMIKPQPDEGVQKKQFVTKVFAPEISEKDKNALGEANEGFLDDKKEIPQYSKEFAKTIEEMSRGKVEKSDDKPVIKANEYITEETEVKETKTWEIVGQVFKTYIIAQCGDEMIFVDQHAAHERLNYEKLLKEYEEAEVISQLLIMSETVDLSTDQMDAVLGESEFFRKLGLEIDAFGANTVVVRTVPMDVDYAKIRELVSELADMLVKTKSVGNITDRKNDALHMIACRSSIKAGLDMSEAEMEKLLEDVMKLDNINTCPHGRPIVLSMDKKYIEKQFGRIV